MPYSLVQPCGRDRYPQATVMGIHETVMDAYDALDAIAETLQRNSAPGRREPVRDASACLSSATHRSHV